MRTPTGFLLGKTTWLGKSYSHSDCVHGTVSREAMGLSDNWYGGFIPSFGKTKEGVYLCLDKYGEVHNIYIPLNGLSNLTIKGLEELCSLLKVEHNPKATKADLIKLLGGDTPENA